MHCKYFDLDLAILLYFVFFFFLIALASSQPEWKYEKLTNNSQYKFLFSCRPPSDTLVYSTKLYFYSVVDNWCIQPTNKLNHLTSILIDLTFSSPFQTVNFLSDVPFSTKSCVEYYTVWTYWDNVSNVVVQDIAHPHFPVLSENPWRFSFY